MQLFGIRATSVTMGLVLMAATLGVLAAGSNGPAATRYQLIAPLQATGGRVFACFSDALMDPASCGGIEVKGVDISQLPDGGGNRGLPFSHPMRLVGTWDGQALTLTEAPQPAPSAPGLPQPCTQDFSPGPGSDTIQLQIEVADALRKRGVGVLMSTGCDRTTVGVVLPVVDDATVVWLTSHYRVKVAGWLQPLPSGR